MKAKYQPNGQKVTYFAPPELIKEFDAIAEKNYLTRSGMLRQVMLQRIKQEKRAEQ